MDPLHPGEVLLEEYLIPLNISQNKLALHMRVPAQRISEIINGKRAITADTAAVQNMNLMFGLNETAGLNLKPVAF